MEKKRVAGGSPPQREEEEEEREYLLRRGGVRERERGDLRLGGGDRLLIMGGDLRRILQEGKIVVAVSGDGDNSEVRLGSSDGHFLH